MTSIRSRPARALIFVIELYRNLVSPMRLPCCRFTPTCSHYAVDALGGYGLFRGGWLTIVRLAKCGPWHPGGWDPVPERSVSPTRQAGEAAVDRSVDVLESEPVV